MGDAGALFLGFLIATLTIRLNPNVKSEFGSYLVPILLLAIPILDTSVAVLSRVRRHVSPFQGGQDHLSHRLVRSGMSRKQAAFSLWSLTGVFAIFVILINQPSLSIHNYLISGAGLLWLLLFVLFFRTADA